MMKKLFTAFSLGSLSLKNRIVMGSMTRCRADPATGNVTPEMVQYYHQRAESAAVILTECLYIEQNQNAYPGAPGMVTEEHVEGWSKIADAVHAQGSFLVAQLYHPGRVLHPDMGGAQPIGPSPVKCEAKAYIKGQQKDHVVPREMTMEDIRATQQQFVRAAALAKRAGLDGIELHASNGYLIDQFLRSSSNMRKDNYGGSLANRSRYLLELIDQLTVVFPAERIGVKLSLVGRFQGMREEDPLGLGRYMLGELGHKGVCYVQLMEAESRSAVPVDNGHEQIPNCAQALRDAYCGVLLTNGFGEPTEGARRLVDGEADMAVFSTMFISNPDLTARLKNGWPLVEPLREFFYAPGPRGYTDYPRYTQV